MKVTILMTSPERDKDTDLASGGRRVPLRFETDGQGDNPPRQDHCRTSLEDACLFGQGFVSVRNSEELTKPVVGARKFDANVTLEDPFIS
jgi:hypothetical protein